VILLIVIILVAAAITGSLGGVLEIAAGVALGLILFVVGIALLGYFLMRSRWRQSSRWDRRGPPQRYDI
jgi:Kef-type K+ transport system membrane component KefB